MKRRVILIAHTMNIGGVEKALLGQLTQYDPAQWDVHVGLLEPKGGFLSYLPPHVTLHEIAYYKRFKDWINRPPLENITSSIKSLNLTDAFGLTAAYISYKITHSQKFFYDHLFRRIATLEGEFDLAIAYAGPFSFIDYYVTQKIKAREKWGWVHYDLSKFHIDKKIISSLYSAYSRINLVSEQGKNIFDRMFPQFKDKTAVHYNIVAKDEILRLANQEATPLGRRPGVVTIVTVGRVSREKGQLKTLHSLKALIDRGHQVQWYYVGAGNDLEHCKQVATELSVDNHAFFVGAKANPYPYMKHCDIYVQPSLHEGYCITLAEAKLFGHPIVATDFTGAREQLEPYQGQWEITGHNHQDITLAIEHMIELLHQ